VQTTIRSTHVPVKEKTNVNALISDLQVELYCN
jgi:hypothetical protein